jgi:hypothetical protein
MMGPSDQKDNSENDASPRSPSQDVRESLRLPAPREVRTQRLARVVTFSIAGPEACCHRQPRTFLASKLRVDHHEFWTDGFHETRLSIPSQGNLPTTDGA